MTGPRIALLEDAADSADARVRALARARLAGHAVPAAVVLHEPDDAAVLDALRLLERRTGRALAEGSLLLAVRAPGSAAITHIGVTASALAAL